MFTLAAIKDKLRASPLLLIFLVTLVGVFALAPQKAALALWGVSRIAMGGYLGYWTDRLVFHTRPHQLQGIERGAAEKRRSTIVAASIIAAGLIP